MGPSAADALMDLCGRKFSALRKSFFTNLLKQEFLQLERNTSIMAAYAALVSVMHIISQLENHPRPPISLDKVQAESLTEKVTFLQEFLEGYKPIGKYEEDGVENRIRDAAHAAEDVIESHIIDCIEAGSTSHVETRFFVCDFRKILRFAPSKSTSHANEVEFGQRLQKVIEDMDLIKNEAVETKEKMAVAQRSSTSSSSGHKQNITMERNLTSSFTEKKQSTTMVGFRDALDELLDKLTRGEDDRQIIPITGMGGIGKTTLAQSVYEHPLIRECFKIHAWVTISQEYDAENIVNEIISQSNKDKGNSSEVDVKKKGDDLHKYLFDRRYLIVMDDMWSIEAWDKMKYFFPNNKNGSRIVVTTRLSNLSRQLSNSYSLEMRFLDFNESWDLFSGIVFQGDDYPYEAVEIGRKITVNCRGLPLSTVVVAGFLAKSEYKREYWEYIEENLSLFVNSDSDEQYLKILQLSYNQLPVHLKPCFLYMGVFKEDSEISIFKLVVLWIAEGFLKPISGKDLEEVAMEYLNDLIDRNLVFMEERHGSCVKIHDLLRDLCLRQAKAEKFHEVVTHHTDYIPDNQRRIVVRENMFKEKAINILRSIPLTRSLICYGLNMQMPPYHKLLRIFDADAPLKIDDKLHLFNLRYLSGNSYTFHSKFISSLHFPWSLQTLILKCDDNDDVNEPLEIWNMPQLRHVVVSAHMYLSDPPVCNGQDGIVLENLHTLMRVRNFKCTEEVVKRIPNVRVLHLEYNEDEEESCLSNLDRLDKLKVFYCKSFRGRDRYGTDFIQKLTFPSSLMEITLDFSKHVHLEDLLEKIGLLPLLLSLILFGGVFRTHVWETVEGHFPNLKFLKLSGCDGLEIWNAESSHFPRLEHLVLHKIKELKEIPSGIGEIPTLQSIQLRNCSNSAVISCKEVQQEQEELNGEKATFQVSVSPCYALRHLESPNFKFSLR